MAKAKGVDVAKVVGAVVAEMNSHLADAVTAGHLTQAQADEMKTHATERATRSSTASGRTAVVRVVPEVSVDRPRARRSQVRAVRPPADRPPDAPPDACPEPAPALSNPRDSAGAAARPAPALASPAWAGRVGEHRAARSSRPMPPTQGSRCRGTTPVRPTRWRALAGARAGLGDTFVVDSGRDRFLFVFSPDAVREFYALPEHVASKGLADYRMLLRKLPKELFADRRTFAHDLFGAQDVEGYLGHLDTAISPPARRARRRRDRSTSSRSRGGSATGSRSGAGWVTTRPRRRCSTS